MSRSTRSRVRRSSSSTWCRRTPRNRHDARVDHHDHVALIRGGVEGAGPRWLELGAGDGAFTLALADLLGAGGVVTAIDRDDRALRRAADAVASRFPATTLALVPADFERGLPPGPFDGVLAANSLHFVADRRPVLAAIGSRLAPGGRLVVVEYDADRGNPWVPHPFAFATWMREAVDAGFEEPRLLHRVPSRFLGAIYGAVTVPRGSLDEPTAGLHSRPHGEDRGEYVPVGHGASAGGCEPRGHDGRERRSRAVRLAPDSAPRA